MGHKELNELTITSQFQGGDLMLVRKSAEGIDKALTYESLVNSIGSPAVHGFTAVQAIDGDDIPIANTIQLTPVNGSLITTYKEGMKISFKSPIKSTGAVAVQISTLNPVALYRYNTAHTAEVDKGEYVEAIFIDNHFERVNDLRSQAKANVFTNDYKVILAEIATDKVYTNIVLQSSYGLPKTEYYEGMTINFICPVNTAGWTKVRIDDLGYAQLSVNTYDELEANEYVATPLFKDTMVLATYVAGGYFLINKFATPVTDPTIKVQVTKQGTSENGGDGSGSKSGGGSQTQTIPKTLVVTVKNDGSCKYQTLAAAYYDLINTYKEDGGGLKATIIVEGMLSWNTQELSLTKPYPWITVQGVNNKITIRQAGTTSTVYNAPWSSGHPPQFARGTEIILQAFDDTTNHPPYYRSALFQISSTLVEVSFTDLKITINNGMVLQSVFDFNDVGDIKLDQIIIDVKGKVEQVLHVLRTQARKIMITGSYFNAPQGTRTYGVSVSYCTSTAFIFQNSDITKNGTIASSDLNVPYNNGNNSYVSVTQINTKAGGPWPSIGTYNGGNIFSFQGSRG